MIEYLGITGLFAAIMFFMLIIACLAHLEFRDARSAENVRFMLGATLATPLWPLMIVAALVLMVYALVKSVGDVFKKEYR